MGGATAGAGHGGDVDVAVGGGGGEVDGAREGDGDEVGLGDGDTGEESEGGDCPIDGNGTHSVFASVGLNLQGWYQFGIPARSNEGQYDGGMPSLSERSYRIPASPIRKLAGAAERARGAGKQILALNIGQPDVSSPKEFWEEIAKIPHNYLAYSHSAGDARLREQAAAYYRGVGIEVATEEVLITTAGSEALQMAMVACLNPGDEVIVPEPMYANYIGFAALADVTVVPIPTRIEENFALPDAGAFAERITPRTKAILINNPGNPTGTVYNDEQLDALRAICLEHDLFLIADEVYRDFNYTGRPIRSCCSWRGWSGMR